MTKGALLRLYLAASGLAAPLARRHLAKRLARGKEDPVRWREKLGQASIRRPEGPLVWLHAVGVGEVLALPALARALQRQRPGLQVLITSSTRTSAAALAPNLPDGVLHQYLPLDVPAFVHGFLDHWRPDLAVWAERDIWPSMVVTLAERQVPQVLVNGRMDQDSFRAKKRVGGLFRDLYRLQISVGVQDRITAEHFAALGVEPGRIVIDGSLKSGADPLADLPEMRAAWLARLSGRRVWLAASTHEGDETVVAEAHRLLRQSSPDACLIVAPRDPVRAEAVVAGLRAAGLSVGMTHRAEPGLDAYVVPVIGQMGLWYRLADAALVGGSLAMVGGHNPHEPALLGCAILHGPNVKNFAADYAAYHDAGVARLVRDARELATALADPDLQHQCEPAIRVAQQGRAALDRVAQRMLAQLGGA